VADDYLVVKRIIENKEDFASGAKSPLPVEAVAWGLKPPPPEEREMC